MNNQNRKILKINKEVIIIIVLILYFILNTPANKAPSGLNAIDKPIIVDIATSNLRYTESLFENMCLKSQSISSQKEIIKNW